MLAKRCLQFLLFCLSLSACMSMNSGPYWKDETLRVTGFGAGPQSESPSQKQLMAQRAAKVNAVHNLMIQIKNLPVDARKAGDYLPETWVPTGFVEESVQHYPDGTCSITLAIPLHPVWQIVQENREQKQ